jgi:hypothetical protein
MGLKPSIVHCLRTQMKPLHPSPFKLHEVALPLILGNPSSPVLVHAPTGHGKTAAFTLPILQACMTRPGPSPQDGPVALVLTQNRSLARQHRESILSYGRGKGVVAVAVVVDRCLLRPKYIREILSVAIRSGSVTRVDEVGSGDGYFECPLTTPSLSTP